MFSVQVSDVLNKKDGALITNLKQIELNQLCNLVSHRGMEEWIFRPFDHISPLQSMTCDPKLPLVRRDHFFQENGLFICSPHVSIYKITTLKQKLIVWKWKTVN